MCYAWVPYAVAAIAAAGGSKMQADAQNEAADRQQQALNASLEQSDQWSRKAEQKALDNAQEYNVEDRTQRLEQAKEDAGESLTQSLVKSREEIGSPDQASGKLSDAFITDRANKMANQFEESVNMARLMGRMRGVQDMLGSEAQTNADYATQLATIGRNAQGDYSAAQPGIAAAGKVDSGSMALGGLIQGAGTAYLGSGLGNAFGTASSSGAGTLGSGTYGIMPTSTGATSNTLFGGSMNTGYDLGSGLSKIKMMG